MLDDGFRLLLCQKKCFQASLARPLPGKFGGTPQSLLRDRYAKCCLRCDRRCAKAAQLVGHRPGLSRDWNWAAVRFKLIQTVYAPVIKHGDKKRLVVDFPTM